MRNWCWAEWWYEFINLKIKLAKLPFVNPKKLDHLYSDIELYLCNPHDDFFDEWGGLFDFIRANYIFALDLLGLLHWTSITARFIIFMTVFMWLNLFGWRTFNWSNLFYKN